ncbi:unnamed protein product [Enterobius vermicularis]|uniref:ubiquitinyl hydrolase 1 n=1 Tax=Enterobius vermicularis TaxID=51028 RepID=A0A0N4V3A9_ENTVE|nr:unnamed protein product [Enterobius vermicularis]
MVDCPHLVHSVCIAKLDLEQLKRLSSKRVFKVGKEYEKEVMSSFLKNGIIYGETSKKLDEADDTNWNCVECGTSQCPWLCLSCGLIHCGSYQCDDYVGNDTDDNKIASVRSSLQFYNRLRCDDHNYSSSKYDSVLEPEDVVEISADGSLQPFCDEGVGEETDESVTNNDSDSPLYNSVVDSSGSHYCGQSETNEFKNSLDIQTDKNGFILASSSGIDSLHRFISRKIDYNEKNFLSLQSLSAQGSAFLESGVRKRKRETSRPLDAGQKSSASDEILSYAPANNRLSPNMKKIEADRKLRGLRNLGNTCFMNSVLQALGCIEIFRYFMRNLPPTDCYTYMTDPVSPQSPRYYTRNSSTLSLSEAGVQPTFVSEELRKTLIEISNISEISNSGSSINAFGPVAFLEEVRKFAPRFRGFQQHDAHEFLRCILDRMQVELKNYRLPDWLISEIVEDGVQKLNGSHFSTTKHENNSSKDEKKCPIAAMFEGTLQSQVTCLSCSTISNKQDPFLDLSLDILCPLNSSRTAVVQLSDCLQRFFAKEELDSDEQYMCNKCSGKRPSTKQLFIKVLPNVLCLHLKRFRWSSFHRGKLDNMVEFPLKGLDMKPYMTFSFVSDSRSETDHLSPDSRSNSYSSCSSLSGCLEDNMIYDLTSLVVHHGGG